MPYFKYNLQDNAERRTIMLNETIQKEFQRKEIKYLIEADTFEQLQKEFKDYLTPDRFTHSSITNIYFDNPDFQLIKDSIFFRNQEKRISG